MSRRDPGAADMKVGETRPVGDDSPSTPAIVHRYCDNCRHGEPLHKPTAGGRGACSASTCNCRRYDEVAR